MSTSARPIQLFHQKLLTHCTKPPFETGDSSSTFGSGVLGFRFLVGLSGDDSLSSSKSAASLLLLLGLLTVASNPVIFCFFVGEGASSVLVMGPGVMLSHFSTCSSSKDFFEKLRIGRFTLIGARVSGSLMMTSTDAALRRFRGVGGEVVEARGGGDVEVGGNNANGSGEALLSGAETFSLLTLDLEVFEVCL